MYYSAEQSRAGWLRAARGLMGYPGSIWRHRGLVWNFARRELLGRFRGSFLGIFWVLVHPLFLFAIYYAVFGYLFGNAKLPDGSPDPTFAVYLFAGILAWTAFFEGTQRACTTIVENGNLVKKVAFPCELLPVHLTLVAMAVYLVGAAVLIGVGTLFGAVRPGASLLLWPAVLVVHFFFTLGFGLLLAAVYVFIRDTHHLYGVLSTAWFFASPIFWHPRFMEDKLGPGLAGVLTLNPTYPLIQAHRQVLGVGYDTAGPFGSLVPEPLTQNLAAAGAWALGFMVVGYGFFMSRRHKFADLV